MGSSVIECSHDKSHSRPRPCKCTSPNDPCCRSGRRTICWRTFCSGARMATPLDPVIAQIIPLLPLRDPKTMTPQSARNQLRALAASRAAIPPPPVQRGKRNGSERRGRLACRARLSRLG